MPPFPHTTFLILLFFTLPFSSATLSHTTLSRTALFKNGQQRVYRCCPSLLYRPPPSGRTTVASPLLNKQHMQKRYSPPKILLPSGCPTPPFPLRLCSSGFAAAARLKTRKNRKGITGENEKQLRNVESYSRHARRYTGCHKKIWRKKQDSAAC